MDAYKLCIIWKLLFLHGYACSRNPEDELLKFLFENHSSDSLPRKSVDSPILLDYQIAIRQIIDVDERSQVLSTNVWIRQYWNDPYLSWNVSKWSNISFLSISPKKIWIPDITLYNNANDGFQGLQDFGKTKISVYPTGDCMWLVPVILRSECKMSMDYFPFDKQNCPLEFGSWAYDMATLHLRAKTNEIDMAAYSENGEFVVKGGKVDHIVEKFACCPNPYVTLKFHIELERRTEIYMFNLLIPGVIIAILTCFTFLLPPGSGERTGLIITNLLALSVYVLMVSDEIPPSPDSIPMIVKFYTTLVSEIGIALMINCIIIPINLWNTPMPSFIKKVFIDILGPLMLCNRKCKSICKKNSMAMSFNEISNGNLIKTNGEHILSNGINEFRMQDKRIEEKMQHLSSRDTDLSSGFEKDVIKHMKIITDIMTDDKMSSAYNDEWDLLTKVLDRIFFIIFFIIIVSSALILMFVRSHE